MLWIGLLEVGATYSLCGRASGLTGYPIHKGVLIWQETAFHWLEDDCHVALQVGNLASPCISRDGVSLSIFHRGISSVAFSILRRQ